MEAIYAGLITVLFSAWVWDLKSQADSAARRPGATGRRNGGGMHTSPADTLSTPSHIVKPNPAHMSAAVNHSEGQSAHGDDSGGYVNRHNGVPVWVIE